MPFHQEATFHDRQFMFNEDVESTSSTDFVDLPGAELTTKNLSIDGNYALYMSILISGSLNNTLAAFRLLVDGVPVGPNETIITLKVKDLDIGYTLHGIATSIPSGTILKVQYKTNVGTLTVTEFNILIDGIPQSRVVV